MPTGFVSNAYRLGVSTSELKNTVALFFFYTVLPCDP